MRSLETLPCGKFENSLVCCANCEHNKFSSETHKPRCLLRGLRSTQETSESAHFRNCALRELRKQLLALRNVQTPVFTRSPDSSSPYVQLRTIKAQCSQRANPGVCKVHSTETVAQSIRNAQTPVLTQLQTPGFTNLARRSSHGLEAHLRKVFGYDQTRRGTP